MRAQQTLQCRVADLRNREPFLDELFDKRTCGLEHLELRVELPDHPFNDDGGARHQRILTRDPHLEPSRDFKELTE